MAEAKDPSVFGQIEVEVLGFKSPSYFIVKENPDAERASYDAIKFQNLEDLLQVEYNGLINDETITFTVGQHVAVFEKIASKTEPCWFRGEILNILDSSRSLLYIVCLIDYGFEYTVKRDSIRRLKDHLGEKVVPRQAIEFHLIGCTPVTLNSDLRSPLKVQYKPTSKWDDSALTYVKKQAALSEYFATILVENQSKNKLYGNIIFANSIDLRHEFVKNKYAVSDAPAKVTSPKSTDIRMPKASSLEINNLLAMDNEETEQALLEMTGEKIYMPVNETKIKPIKHHRTSERNITKDEDFDYVNVKMNGVSDGSSFNVKPAGYDPNLNTRSIGNTPRNRTIEEKSQFTKESSKPKSRNIVINQFSSKLNDPPVKEQEISNESSVESNSIPSPGKGRSSKIIQFHYNQCSSKALDKNRVLCERLGKLHFNDK